MNIVLRFTALCANTAGNAGLRIRSKTNKHLFFTKTSIATATGFLQSEGLVLQTGFAGLLHGR